MNLPLQSLGYFPNARFSFYGAPLGTKAQERDRTADLVLTKDVLYRLSYLGASVDGL
jgi:hypothetical protein